MEKLLKRAVLRQDKEPDPMIVAIRQVVQQIEIAQNRFSMETDPDLIEGCIFQLESLQAQYRYLLRCARDRGITCGEKVTLFNE